MQSLVYITLRLFVFFFTLLPFRVLYWISNGLQFLFFYVIKYRYSIIKSNLEKSFPRQSEQNIQQLMWAFYQNLSDIFLEGIKGLSMSKMELIKRYRFVNPEVLENYYNQKQSIIILASHYGNWEWGARAIGYQIKHHTIGIAAPVKNQFVHDYLKSVRDSENVTTVEMKQTPRAFVQYKEQTAAFVFIMDQSPRNTRGAHWVNFLNQETACLQGADYYARRMNYPVFFAVQKRISRGYYEVELQLLERQSSQLPEEAITKRYMKKLEEIVLQKPENWLWSHRRWKHKTENKTK
ncbi:MAG: lysophospholipid acyltransferase family protein [Saprospiraceae bacterium]